MESILFLVIGLAAGAAIGFFLAKLKAADAGKAQEELRIQLARAEENKSAWEKKYLELEQKNASLQQEFQTLLSENASLKAEGRALNEKLEGQKKELEELHQKMSLEFKNLAHEIFEEKSKKFTDQNKVNIGEVLNPLKEKILEFEKKVEDSNKENVKMNSSLGEQLKQLKELNQQITKEAENLTKALKGDTKTQGNWGEFILESILEKSGLQKGSEFIIQESTTTESGRLRPDVVVKLPDSKNIIIDSKVSLVAYEQAVNAETEEERMAQLKMHVQSLKNHIKQLAAKDYQNLYGVEGLDFILLFVPIEPAFSTALQAEPELFNLAYEKQIVLVSPTTLLATLRTVSNIWRYEYQNRNVLEIAKQAGDMYDKFVNFSDDLVKLGQQMDTAKKSYSDAMNKLVDGNGNLVRRAERLKELGAKTSKQMNDKLLGRSMD
ncbi:MAG: DNA recombination protein RmuC [Bacteroidetes bacterium]|nr:MAG: DNA recombination protein RmuC [Bacteroidota bacterium]